MMLEGAFLSFWWFEDAKVVLYVWVTKMMPILQICSSQAWNLATWLTNLLDGPYQSYHFFQLMGCMFQWTLIFRPLTLFGRCKEHLACASACYEACRRRKRNTEANDWERTGGIHETDESISTLSKPKTRYFCITGSRAQITKEDIQFGWWK